MPDICSERSHNTYTQHSHTHTHSNFRKEKRMNFFKCKSVLTLTIYTEFCGFFSVSHAVETAAVRTDLLCL